MSFILSLVLYNPLEALLLLWCCHLFRRKEYIGDKLELKKLFFDSYKLGTIMLLFQYPMTWLEGTIYLVFYANAIAFIVMPLILFIYVGAKCKLIVSYGIVCIYASSINIIVKLLGYSVIPSLMDNMLYVELTGNLSIKAIQFALITGGIIMKKILKEMAKKNLNQNPAPTILGWGIPKMTEKLKEEIKK